MAMSLQFEAILKFRAHTALVARKANGILALHQCFNIQHIIYDTILYKTLVCPILEYGNI